MEAKSVKVQANKLGFYNLRRYREGQIFEMSMDAYMPKDKNGKPKLDAEGKPKVCQWVDAVEGYELNAETGKVETKLKSRKAIQPKE